MVRAARVAKCMTHNRITNRVTQFEISIEMEMEMLKRQHACDSYRSAKEDRNCDVQTLTPFSRCFRSALGESDTQFRHVWMCAARDSAPIWEA